MRTLTIVGSLLASALLASVSGRALAEEGEQGNAPTLGSGTVEPLETTSVKAPPPVEAEAPTEIVQLDERTAYMVGRHKIKLGLLAFEYGITQQISIGSEPPAWLVRAFTTVLVPNLHLKWQIFDQGPVAVAFLPAAYYANIGSANFSGNLFDIPLSLFVSVKVHPRITLHAEGAFVFARVFGTGNITQAELSGVTAVRAGQLGLMAQYQLTRVVSLLATGRYQFYEADLPLSGSAMTDPYTTANLSGQYVPPVKHPWEAIGGVAFLWHYLRVTVGGGYGYYFVPGLNIANTKKTFVPDASVAVVL